MLKFKSQGLNQHKICGPKGTSTWFLATDFMDQQLLLLALAPTLART